MILRQNSTRNCFFYWWVAVTLWFLPTGTTESNVPNSNWRGNHPLDYDPPGTDWPPPPPPPLEEQTTVGEDATRGFQQQPPDFTNRPPIDYSFPKVDDESADATPKHRRQPNPTFTARQDPITRFKSQGLFHQVVFRSSCATVGAGFGVWLGRSIVGKPYPLPLATLSLILSYLRGNVYGEWIQALAMVLILSFQRFQSIRKRYPARRYMLATIGLIRLAETERLDRSEHQTIYVIAAMGLVGSFVGGSIPLLPTSLGSLAGAVTFALGPLQPTIAGDVCYCMGVRLVALAREVWRMNAELGLVDKSGAALSKLINTILVFDRKHRVQEKLGSFALWVKDRVSNDGAEPPVTKRRRPPGPKNGMPPPRRRPPPPPNDRQPPGTPNMGSNTSSQPPTPQSSRKDIPTESMPKKWGWFGRRAAPKRTPRPPPPQSVPPDETTIEPWEFGGEMEQAQS